MDSQIADVSTIFLFKLFIFHVRVNFSKFFLADMMEDDKSIPSNNRNNGMVIEDDENELYCQLPPGVVFPESDAGFDSEESSASSSPQNQRLLAKIYSLIT